ncbi:MerR family transcriptional regulator [Bythopirellula goksoeyrii]|uniref:Helix-turn-helix domain protein n=1 Tax=Bythopirellula goksoeyrii TaxID=1400387 RepID=A0A5B9QA10_9BACT|nr:helix-turn-helix domain-containing protein [Bythopirellula goksoeyrii]QEG34440.1 Helix-turn-helix domain protein [Bythopirellula goksoeyrii]
MTVTANTELAALLDETKPAALKNEDQAAAFLGNISKKHLFNLRKYAGLPFIPVGNRIMYSPESLAEWCKSREQRIGN